MRSIIGKRVLAILLFSAFAVISVSCQSTPVENSAKNDAPDTAAGTADNIDPKIEAKDYGGRTFTFLTRPTNSFTRQLDDISAEEENASTINDEIYRRNLRIMEKYNLVFQYNISDKTSDTIKKSVEAGENLYQIVFNGINDNIPLSTLGIYYNLSELPFVDLSKPYWCNAIMDDLSLFGKNYFGVSNLTCQAYFSSGIVYYNKQVAKDFNIDSPYELVRSGDWTFDRMLQMCSKVSVDLDGNGIFDEKDKYGVTFNNFAWQEFFYGGGETFVKKDNEGALYFDRTDERINNFIQKLMPISQKSQVVLYSEKYGSIGGDYRADVCRNAFNEARALFWLDCMYGVTTVREMKADFGILPVPKWDDAQEKYASFIHTGHASSVAVPMTVNDVDMVGRVLEELTYGSYDVRNAFIEITLKVKLARDDESADMIDIIINNIRTDYALLLPQFDSLMRKMLDNGSTDIASFYESNCGKFGENLKQINEAAKGVR